MQQKAPVPLTQGGRALRSPADAITVTLTTAMTPSRNNLIQTHKKGFFYQRHLFVFCKKSHKLIVKKQV
jgi:hypothetical protein